MQGADAPSPLTQELQAAFPASCAEAIASLVPRLPWRAGLPTSKYYEVRLGTERLRIPERIYFEVETLDAAELLPPREPNLLGWYFTRHHDGHVRERCLRRVIGTPAPWAPAYVLRLLGESVVEILEVLRTHLPASDPTAYRDFILENPGFYEATRGRVESYWDCYYRDQPRSTYAGFAVLDALAALVRDDGGR